VRRIRTSEPAAPGAVDGLGVVTRESLILLELAGVAGELSLAFEPWLTSMHYDIDHNAAGWDCGTQTDPREGAVKCR
jgi:hypothetical protein